MNNNIDKQKLLNAIIASSGGKINKENLAGAVNNKDVSSLMQNLSPEDKQKISSVLANKSSLASALNSAEAKAILKSLLNGGTKS